MSTCRHSYDKVGHKVGDLLCAQHSTNQGIKRHNMFILWNAYMFITQTIAKDPLIHSLFICFKQYLN